MCCHSLKVTTYSRPNQNNTAQLVVLVIRSATEITERLQLLSSATWVTLWIQMVAQKKIKIKNTHLYEQHIRKTAMQTVPNFNQLMGNKIILTPTSSGGGRAELTVVTTRDMSR